MSATPHGSVAARFSAAAATYDKNARVQRAAAAGVIRLVDGLPSVERILEIGCGTGILTELLVERFPSASIEAVDISDAMISRACAHIGNRRNVKFVTADIREMRDSSEFSLAASSATLHWVAPLADTFDVLRSALVPDGHLAFSIMLSGTLAELRAAKQRVAPLKVTVSNLPTRDEVLKDLIAQDFSIIDETLGMTREIHASASEMLRAIHDQGVTGGLGSVAALNRTELARLVDDYDLNYQAEGGVAASYEIMYVLAKKG